jgi:cell division protein FtsB
LKKQTQFRKAEHRNLQNKANFRTTLTIPKSFGFEAATLALGQLKKQSQSVTAEDRRQKLDKLKKRTQFCNERIQKPENR